MKFVVRHKEKHGHELKNRVIKFLEKNGADWTESIEKADFAIIIGGDGTFMRDHFRLKSPVLGIKAGSSIGYYLRADTKDWKEKVSLLLTGKEGKDYHIHELMRLEASINDKKLDALALNDVLVNPVYVRRMFRARVSLTSGRGVERNSGIIVYTPTGSSAFAHSAGARKIPYGKGMMGVTALAPYSGMLKKKEITIERGTVRIECLSETGEVCFDGSETNVWEISKGDVVKVSKSSNPLKVVSFSKRFS